MFERCEYWRLADKAGKPPGLMGWWPSRAVTFLENHDTGSTQGHWRFPAHALEQGYVYLLTHPGTPTGELQLPTSSSSSRGGSGGKRGRSRGAAPAVARVWFVLSLPPCPHRDGAIVEQPACQTAA